MNLTPYGVEYLHVRPAWRAAWWSVLLPGLGHFYAGSQLKGLVLMGWEAFINHHAHLNLAIFYSILGEGQRAAAVLKLEWAILYPFPYLYAMWDSYRLVVEINKLAQIEERQTERYFERTRLHPITGVNSLDKRNPWVAGFFSMLVGGLGHFYNFRSVKALTLTGWFILVVMFSSAHKAVAYTLLGQFELAKSVIDYQWFLFLPSIMLFNVIDAFNDSIELNNLYDEEWEYRFRAYLENPSRPAAPNAGQQPPFYLPPQS